MSDTIHLACVDCCCEIWVGQARYGRSEGRLYSADEHRAKFATFWQQHGGHDLRLVNANGLDSLDPCGDWDRDDDDDDDDDPTPHTQGES